MLVQMPQLELTMKSLESLKTAAILKALKAQGLGNETIVQLVKEQGWASVQTLA